MQGKFLVAALMQAGRDLPQTSAKRHGHNVNIEGSILLVRVSLVLLQHPSAALGILLLLQLPFELVRNALRCTSHDAESIWVGVNTQGAARHADEASRLQPPLGPCHGWVRLGAEDLSDAPCQLVSGKSCWVGAQKPAQFRYSIQSPTERCGRDNQGCKEGWQARGCFIGDGENETKMW